ncbi:agarase [Microbulbifer agarilyticus]|uniref:agarase n=1 Tax=Microbulbifer agarilyticus TaxID=260552 RepID=UPI001CD60237|nr:agarase [Microbulbifer agarilyticus]MCA0892569.1 agarase [Microbulbifer agarilyticus]
MALKSLPYAVAVAVTLACTGGAQASDAVENPAKPSKPAASGALKQLPATIVDFAHASERGWLVADQAELKLPEKGSAQDLGMRFPAASHTPALSIVPDTPWDLSNLDDYNLAFDVTNLAPASTHFYVELFDAHGGSQSRELSVPKGYEGTVFFPLAGEKAAMDKGMWANPMPWVTDELKMVWRSWHGALDLAQITKISFFTIGVLQDRELQVGNIQLRPNPDAGQDWTEKLVDRFGQAAKKDTPLKVASEAELKALAEQELALLAQNTGPKDRSRFGGYKDGPRLEATGYFRTEKVDGKWWMVDPEGYLFFSHGPANVRMSNLTTLTGVDFKDPSVRVVHADEVTPEDSMGIVKVSDKVRASRYIINDTRHDMFAWLPEYDHPLADHYSYRRSTHKGPVPHGETYSFYRANLERRYGETAPESYVKKWEEVTLQRMNSWGFTSFGNWVDPAFYPNEKVPYFANGWIIGDYQTLSGDTNHWGLMPDFFDPVFAERARATIEVIANDVQASPWCVGVFIDNEKSWGEREGTVAERYGVILDALSKDSANSPAKHAFTRRLQAQYGTVAALNRAWGSQFESWDAFAAGASLNEHTEAQVADLSSLLEALGEQYFKVVHGTLKEYLPDHLYMGARMANWGMPDEIIKASVKYSDVLSFNIYEEGMQTHQWDFLEDIDLPVVIGEFHIGATSDSDNYHPGIVSAASQKDRARMYKAYMRSVLEKDYMVGAHWFQYVDEPVTGRAFDGENANIGFVTVTDIPYPEMVEAAKEITFDLYRERHGK